jgi:hypothetical protein
MNNQPIEQKEIKVRKKKILTDPESLRASCRVCKEYGNLENMIWDKKVLKDIYGKEIYGAFEGVYFCSENCKGVFGVGG